ncbi:MAG: ABC transporter ATP-binding protein/permease [Acidiferrobacterales bacterium]|nr:ABC transporter ATP-binding protein/permease [Acidiferrobacterales bacterium]
MNFKASSIVLSIFIDSLKFAPFRACFCLLVMLVNSLLSGVSIALIVPLMATAGFDVGANSSILMGWFDRGFSMLGLKPELASILALYILLVSLVAAIGFFNTVAISALQQSYAVHLRKEMSEALFYSRWQYLSESHLPDFVRLLITQIQTVSSCVTLFMRFISSVILVLVYVFLSSLLSLKLTVLVLLCAGVLFAIALPFYTRIRESGHSALENNRALYRSIFETTSSLKVIKSYAAEELFLSDVQRYSKSVEKQQIRLIKLSATTTLINTVGATIVFALLFYGASNWFNTPIINLLTMLFIFMRLMPHISSIQSTVQNLIHQAPAYQDQLNQLKELKQWAEPRVFDESIGLKRSITLDNVSFIHRSLQEPSVKNISATIFKNQSVAILGASGAGKSTLVDIISGLVVPSSGRILIDDKPLNDERRLGWRRKIAYVTQDMNLFHDTVRANLTWVLDKDERSSEEKLWAALELAAADEFVKNLPNGLDTVIGDRGIRISGGERQRVALARALLSQPEVLILDEATSALDQKNELKIKKSLESLDGKVTIIIIAHNESTIEHVAQRIELS